MTLIYSCSFPSTEAWSLPVFERSSFPDLLDKAFLKWQNYDKYFTKSFLKSGFRWFTGIYGPECMGRWPKCLWNRAFTNSCCRSKVWFWYLFFKIHWDTGTPFMGGGGENRLMTNQFPARLQSCNEISISLLLLREYDLKSNDSLYRDVCSGFVA